MGIIPKWMKFASGGYDHISSAYFSRMTTQPSADFKKVIDTYFVKNKKTVNGVEITAKSIIAKADVIYLPFINNSNDSFINLVKNAHHGTMQGTGLVFDPYWGWSNPKGTGYVDTNYNPATQAVNYKLNDAAILTYLQSNVRTATNDAIIGNARTMLRVSPTLGYFFFNLNSASGTTAINIPFYAGLIGATRALNTTVYLKNQNIPNASSSIASDSPSNTNMLLFNYYGGPTLYTGGISFVYIGASLSDDEFTALNLIVNEYLKHSIYLKYGADNWGVKMAKSYFDTLHNFEPYEAWEIYEFIKRHQSDYVLSEKSQNSGAAGLTDWVDSNADGLADSWMNPNLNYDHIYSIITGNGFTGNAQRVQENNALGFCAIRPNFVPFIIGDYIKIKGKYRSSNILRISGRTTGTHYGSLPINTGNAIDFEIDFYADDPIPIFSSGSYIQDQWFEIDEISFKSSSYYYNTFGPNVQNKTVADYIMLFKAGGNLVANAWTKTGETLRWNQDGTITSSNTMPAYTRGTNLGIVTVTSTDGWDGLTVLNARQAYNSVNCFYGNFPRFFGVLKKLGKANIDLAFGRIKMNFYGQNLAANSNSLYVHRIQMPGGVRVNVEDIVGGYYGASVTVVGNRYIYAGYHKISGDVTLFTNEFKGQVAFASDKSVYGTLANISRFPVSGMNFADTSISGGTSTWDRNCLGLDLSSCMLSTSAIDAQLAVCDNHYVGTVVPIKVQTVNLGGSTMGIPTGGANNTNLLSWIAKGTAAGFPPVITVRTT